VLRALKRELADIGALIAQQRRVDERTRGSLEMIRHVQTVIDNKTATYRGR